MTTEELLDAIEAIRVKNNKAHMDIYRLAFKHAPEEARAIVGQIMEYDRQISDLDLMLVATR